MTRSNYIFFALGLASGAICAWWLTKKHYSEITEEEIDSVKDYYEELYSSKNETIDEKIDEVTEAFEKTEKQAKTTTEEIMEYAKMMAEKRYNEKKEEEKIEDVEHPYVISPEEFGEFDEYEKISLIYYDDGILADDDDGIIENVDEIVGIESLTHFGEYEDDSVFVRNDKLKCDYEILLDNNTYTSAIREKMHL